LDRPDILGDMTSKAKPGNRRITGKEQFYTPEPLAMNLTEKLASLVPDFSERTIIEPAGGTGSFLKAAKNFGAKKLVSFDIEPKADGVTLADFLGADLSFISSAVTLSNPPFGRNNSLSIPFFNKAAEASEFIAFIVPRSWRKWSVINRLDRQFHLIHDENLNIDYVDDAGEMVWQKSRLNTCFQIWQKKENTRDLVKVSDQGLVSKAAPADADVAITVFGYGCGKIKTTFERVPNSTVMFLKLHDKRVLPALNRVDFSRFYKNTAYTEALSLQEIRYLLNEEILGDPGLIQER